LLFFGWASPVPPILTSQIEPDLAKQKLARMFVADVYHGLDGIPRGAVKYLRILEQVPRPWSARRWDFDDEYGQQHVAITKGTHLVLKVLHGIVPVEDDGSANYYVPSEANIFVQVLDENYAALQTERTYVHSMPGEMRSCIGCHERHGDVQQAASRKRPLALLREPSFPQPQPGDPAPQRVIDYTLDVQPVWNKHCIECHGADKPQANLRLDGELTRLFNVSYEQLVPDRYEPQKFTDHDLVGLTIGEHHPKTGNVEYLPPKSLGTYSSVLAAMLSDGKITLSDPVKRKRVEDWKQKHADIHLTPEEQIRFQTWIDTNCQYYGSYYGRRNIKYKDRRDFRPQPVFSGKTFEPSCPSISTK
jgi:cytochrome c553